VRLAMYVMCLTQIVEDIKQFLVVLLIVILLFANMILVVAAGAGHTHEDVDDDSALLNGDDHRTLRRILATGSAHGGGEGNVDASGEGNFHSVAGSMLVLYRVMLGDFGGFKATSEYDVAIFVAYTFLVMVMMLNILIAVVSDSYDYAQIRARQLFLSARLDLVAEMDAIGIASQAQFQRSDFGRGPGCSAGEYQDLEGMGAARPNGTGIGSWLVGQLSSIFRMSSTVEDEDDWLGRALDLERRTRKAVMHAEQRLARCVSESELKLLSESKVRAAKISDAVIKAAERRDSSLRQRVQDLEGDLVATRNLLERKIDGVASALDKVLEAVSKADGEGNCVVATKRHGAEGGTL